MGLMFISVKKKYHAVVRALVLEVEQLNKLVSAHLHSYNTDSLIENDCI